jgi:hypothetical protein
LYLHVLIGLYLNLLEVPGGAMAGEVVEHGFLGKHWVVVL